MKKSDLATQPVNIDDQWMLTKILFDFSAQNQCVIRIINPAEGCQFLLVECAYFLDEEDLVDDIDDRIFVANGKIHLVRDKTVVKEFHKHVSDNATEMKESVQDCEKGELI
ncbi:hypothetical protein ACOME3_000209 [Neoechinorhynchus agilis]